MTEIFVVLGKSKIGIGTVVSFNCIIGYPTKDNIRDRKYDDIKGSVVGKNCIIRSGTVVYSTAVIGNGVQTGHNVVVREGTTIGDNSMIGTNVTIENDCVIGKEARLQTNVYVPTNTEIGDNVFIGPNAVLTNDKYMGKVNSGLRGPVISEGVSIGANATILPKVKIGKGSIIGAGALVTKDVPPDSLVMGSPAVVVGKASDTIKKWKGNLKF